MMTKKMRTSFEFSNLLATPTLMRQIISGNAQQKDALNRQQLMQGLGGCERTQKMPIPTCFTRHTSRLLFMWSNRIPFAVYSACVPFFTQPSTTHVNGLVGIIFFSHVTASDSIDSVSIDGCEFNPSRHYFVMYSV